MEILFVVLFVIFMIACLSTGIFGYNIYQSYKPMSLYGKVIKNNKKMPVKCRVLDHKTETYVAVPKRDLKFRFGMVWACVRPGCRHIYTYRNAEALHRFDRWRAGESDEVWRRESGVIDE